MKEIPTIFERDWDQLMSFDSLSGAPPKGLLEDADAVLNLFHQEKGAMISAHMREGK